MTRRKTLAAIVKGVGLAVAAIVGIPSLIVAMSPVIDRRRGPVWRPLGRLEDFPVGDVTKALVEVARDDWARSLRTQAVYVWHAGPQELVVFSRKCTDLSCPIVWDPGSEWFFCPCHGGIFSKEGEPMAGPPKRPLYRYAYRLMNGVVEIDLNSLPPMV
jgi:menaquinol-cytochrome c reductase iron-sulfur subunit